MFKIFKKKRKMPIYNIVIIVPLVLLAGWIAVGYFSSKVEQLPYTVLDSSKEYEIREIKEHLIIETEVSGGFESGGNEAFSILAGYIFGNNKKKEKIAMTTPVVGSESEKIAMTAPVVAEDRTDDLINFSFVVPEKYTLETLPEPLDPRIKIKKVGKKKVAVLRFTGFYNDQKFEDKKEELKKYLKRDKLGYSNFSSAGYNPPWTPPFMRRLEVWAELK
jgi:hypothetical protein